MKSKDLFELKLALVSQLNDQIINNVHFPIAYGLGLNYYFDERIESYLTCSKVIISKRSECSCAIDSWTKDQINWFEVPNISLKTRLEFILFSFSKLFICYIQ